MTIKNAAYTVSKYVKTLPWRKSVADILASSPDSYDQNSPDFDLATLVCSRNNRRRQFFGLIDSINNFDSRAPNSSQNLFDLPQVNLLLCGRRFLMELQSLVLSQLNLVNSPLLHMIIPSGDIHDVEQCSSTIHVDDLPAEVKALCREFGSHPSLDQLLRFDANQIDFCNIDSQFQMFMDTIVIESCLPSVPAFDKMRKSSANNLGLPYPLFAAVAALRSSLGNLSQLLFQAFQTDKLPVFDSDNIFDIQTNEHAIAKWAKISSIWTGDTVGICAGNLVLVNFRSLSGKLPKLARVSHFKLSFSKNSGCMMEVRLLFVDDNMSSYGNLLMSSGPLANED